MGAVIDPGDRWFIRGMWLLAALAIVLIALLAVIALRG